MSASLTPRGLPGIAAGLLGAAVVAAACAPANNPPDIPVRGGGRLVSQIVDQVNDTGRGASIVIGPKGDPMVSYVLATQRLKKGELIPAIVPGQPQPPAIVLADRQNGVWTRNAVPPQSPVGKAVGPNTELVGADGYALDGLQTGLAVDGQGKRHIVWSTPTGLYYSDDTGGGFGTPAKIVETPAGGASIAVGADNVPWVSYFDAAGIHAARLEAGKWITEDVATTGSPVGAPATVTAIRVGPDNNPVVVYGAGGATVVARRVAGDATPPATGGTSGSPGGVTTGQWSTSQAPGPGGLAVSLALDKSGNPHVAYYDLSGTVRHAHSLGGGPWVVTDIARTAPGPNGTPNPGWSTGIALDDKGTHFIVYADTRARDIKLATNATGSFRSASVPESDFGTNPAVAVSADGRTVAIAWYDSVNENLNVATSPTGGLTLAFPTPPLSQPTVTVAPPTSSGPPPCQPSGTELTISAQNISFDKNCLAAPADEALTINFENKDPVPHNLEIFTDQSATTRLGGANGPTDTVIAATATYKVDPLKAGTYFFRCDIHPTQMTGTFVVAKPG